MRNEVIDITGFIGWDLKSRISVRELRDKFLHENKTHVMIDFRNVSFATRSFIDEFYNVFVNNADIYVELINVSPEINAIFDAVKSTQHKSKKTRKWLNSNSVIEFSSISDANNYLEVLSFS